MTSLMRRPPSTEEAVADKTRPEGEVSETDAHRPEPLEGTDTTGTEGGGAGGWSRPERVKPETRKKEPKPPQDKRPPDGG